MTAARRMVIRTLFYFPGGHPGQGENPIVKSRRSTHSFSCWFLPKSTVSITPEPHERLLRIEYELMSARELFGPQSSMNVSNE